MPCVANYERLRVILRTEIWVRLVCGLMLMVRVVDGQGQLEAEEGMLWKCVLTTWFAAEHVNPHACPSQLLSHCRDAY